MGAYTLLPVSLAGMVLYVLGVAAVVAVTLLAVLLGEVWHEYRAEWRRWDDRPLPEHYTDWDPDQRT